MKKGLSEATSTIELSPSSGSDWAFVNLNPFIIYTLAARLVLHVLTGNNFIRK
jgi:hypothetical protein